mmetsp:Transcript_15788/g.33374  ORF Transcript_15788/g.33374 Transcript_15788/m.33374 type:complete len:573 (+) Transcript_15788:171-1889(+)
MATANNADTQTTIGVIKVNDCDIICGRGGLALKHPGNMAYRKIVGLNKELYATCLKTEKLRISKSIVAAIREIRGRFLEREDGKTSSSLEDKDENGNPITWRDIGDKRAVEKTSQALREGQPKLLKKLAQRHDGGNGIGTITMAGGDHNHMTNNFNHMGVGVPQSQMMSQFVNAQQTYNQLQSGLQAQTYALQAQQQQQPLRNSLLDQQQSSFTLAAMIEGQTFSTFPQQNSFVANNNNVDSNFSQESWHDSWGTSAEIAPLPNATLDRGAQHARRPPERHDSSITNDSWGEDDPTPLPFHELTATEDDEHVFSTNDHHQLMSALGVADGVGGGSTHDDSRNSVPAGDIAAKASNNIHKRPSVKFQLKRSTLSSGTSIASFLSEMSIFSCSLSLDSAMDAVERETEFDMLGDDLESGEMSIGTFESQGSGWSAAGNNAHPKGPGRSILRKSNKWNTQSSNNSPPTATPLMYHADPGLMFTSTLDTTPGGVNSGNDISGIMREHRKSAVAFEVDVKRRRSSRMSMCSALTDFSGHYRRDVGSILSIQSADFRALMDDLDDVGSDEESIEKNSP